MKTTHRTWYRQLLFRCTIKIQETVDLYLMSATVRHVALSSPGTTFLTSKNIFSSVHFPDHILNGMIPRRDGVFGVGTRSATWSHMCTFCDKKFQNRSDCKGHINSVHLNTKPFVCKHCTLGYSYRQSLSRHLVNCKMNPFNLISISQFSQKN